MDDQKGWLRAHWRTAVVLVMIFGLALFLRVFFVYGLAFQPVPQNCDANYVPTYSGGSDSYYWDRAICYSFQTGRDIGSDPMNNYPLTRQNPRPPLFPWFALLVGRAFAPLLGNAWESVVYTFLLEAGVFGALTIFPTYALGKEAFGRKAGLIAALLLAISVGHLQRSASTDADHDAFTLFFVVSTFYFFLRALKTMNRRRWVENWFRRDAIRAGLRSFFRENRRSVLYALLAGLCITVVALAWLGWSYVSVILLVWFGAEMFLARFRNEDTMGTWLLFSIALATPLALAFQWYYVRLFIRVWFDVPAYLFLAAFVLGLAFTVTRDYPWTLVIPSTLVAAGVGLAVGVVVNPTLSNALLTGAGYFVQTKTVTTIAEDQPPGMSQMILSFGIFTFGVSLLAIAYLLWQIPRRRDPTYTLVVIWAFAAVFMAVSGARFIFNASPAFAISAGFAIDLVLARADFARMRRTYRSLAEGSWRHAVRESVKARHILTVLGIVFLVLLPNVWYAVDASIPYELKPQYDRQVASLLPSFLRAPGYSPSSQSSFYFGAFGYTVPKATDYYPAAWQWFATQDTDAPPELRPAYLSWWDYGFEALDRGAHPTVADNFQDATALAGQVITSQNESQAIALLVIRLLQGDVIRSGPTFSSGVRASLLNAGLPADAVARVLLRPQDYISVVLSDPVTYGLWAADMDSQNALYVYLTNLITRQLNEDGVVSLYHAIRDATGWDIGYFAVDSRLFPISVSNTGIFYAPVKLSDHRVLNLPDGRVLPVEFFQIQATLSSGSTVPIQYVPPGQQIQSQTIQYQPAFYNSMFYRAYIGYSPTDLGNPTDTGVPGFDQALQSFPPVPAWNLTHWRVVYRTAYYNPYTDPANHTNAWQAMNYDQARRVQADITTGKVKGVVDQSTTTSVANGVVFLRYYDGARVSGTVSAGSEPLPNVWVTVTDELGTPHGLTKTDAQGHYTVLVPFGNVTVTASFGTLTRTTLIRAHTLASATFPVTIDQAMRAPDDANGDGVPDWIITRDLRATGNVAHGTVFFDLNRDGKFQAGDASAPGISVTLANTEFADRRTATSGKDGTYSIDGLPAGTYNVTLASNGRTITGSNLAITSTDATRDIAVPYASVRGYATSSSGGRVAGAQLTFVDATNATVIPVTAQSDGSYVLRPLLAGNYTVTASAGGLASTPTRVNARSADLWLNLTLAPSGTVTGITTLFGTNRPFASLDFQSGTDPRIVRTTTSDESARYSIRLPAGDWFVSGRFYHGTALYAALGQLGVAAGASTAYNAMFVSGARVNGTVRDPNPAVRNPQATVGFSSRAGQLWLRTDASGGYLAFLPVGGYDLVSFNQAGAYFAAVSVAGSTRLDIALLGTSETVGWRVYRDVNGNGAVDAGESIAGARIRLMDDKGVSLLLTTNGTGMFQIPLFGNRTYAGTVDAAGYATFTIPSSSPAELRGILPIALTPLAVSVQGSVLLNGAPILNRPIGVRALAVGDGAVSASTTTDSNGGYGLGLLPGTYQLIVDENVSSTRDLRYQNLGTDQIVVSVGQASLPYDIAIVERTRTLGNVTLAGTPRAASLTFSGPERRAANATTAGFEVYLMAGTYSVTGNRTIAPDEYAFISTATVPSSTSLTFALTKATRATGHALFDGVSVPGPMSVSFVRREGGAASATTDAFGAYTAFLVPGNYSVSLSGANNATEGDVSRFYRYSFAGSATVSPGQASLLLDLDVTRTLDNTTISGTATFAGARVDATITFTARGGGAITAVVLADTTGAYAINLAPGTYDAYATRAFGSAAFLARIAVPHAISVSQDIPLVPAFILAGTTIGPQGAGTSASITLESTAEIDLTSDAGGAYAVVLPAGTYTITATKPGTENGIAVTYRTTSSVVLGADTTTNLLLEKVISRTALLTWDASQQREIAAGGSVTYTIVVQNTGNVADTFDLIGSPADWQFSFAPSSVRLNFGDAGNRTTVQVTIRSPANALVDHGALQILATSDAAGTTVGTVSVQVDVQRVRGLAVSLDPTPPTFNGRLLDYVLVVTNSGNAAETVTVSITNPDDLAAIGWSVTLGPSGGAATATTLTGLTIAANQTLRLRAQGQSTGGSSGATVVVLASAEDTMAVASTGVFTLQLPALASGGVTVSGPEITRTAPVNLQLIAIIAGAVAAIATGLFLTRRRR